MTENESKQVDEKSKFVSVDKKADILQSTFEHYYRMAMDHHTKAGTTSNIILVIVGAILVLVGLDGGICRSEVDIISAIALILLGCTVLIVTIIAWLSARAIVNPIRKLTDAAERMSLGELNVKIDVKSRDEIGLLAQAVGRMQTSLRLAMNRLRRKR